MRELDCVGEVEIEKQNEKVIRCKKIPFIPKGNMILFIRKNFDVFETIAIVTANNSIKRYFNSTVHIKCELGNQQRCKNKQTER